MSRDYGYLLKPVIIIFVLAIVAAVATNLIEYWKQEKDNKDQIQNQQKVENIVEIPDNIVNTTETEVKKEPDNKAREKIEKEQKQIDNTNLNMNVTTETENKTKSNNNKNKNVNLGNTLTKQIKA